MRIFVGIPTYDCKLHMGTAQSLANEAALALAANVPLQISFQPGMSLVHAARNLICADFLASDCTRLVFVDADCGWDAGSLISLAVKPHDVIAGACRRRSEPEGYAIHWGDNTKPNADGLLEVDGIGMAFTAISRQCLEAFRHKTPGRAYKVDGRAVHGFFDSPVSDGNLWGEDIAFCREWRRLGGRVMVDPSITLRHLEGLATYSGNLGRWLSSQPGEPE